MNSWDLIRLVNALRSAGLPVSSQDFAEALESLHKFPFIDKAILLRTIFIHRPQDQPVFQMVWQTIYKPLISETRPSQTKLINNKSCNSGGQGTGQGSGGLSLNPQNPSLEARPILAFNPAAGVTDLPSDLQFEDLLKKALGDMDYYAWINSYELAYQRGDITEEQWLHKCQEAAELQQLVRGQLIAWQVEQENSWLPLRRQYWRHKPLQSLNTEEKYLVQAALKQWGRKLAVRPGWRRHPSSRGKIDFSRTVHNAFQGDGKIFHLSFHRGIPRDPELVILCDVSNSVAPYVEFLLFLVGRIRARFRRVRLFFFIDTLWDVSGRIWDEDLDELQEEIESWGRQSSSGFSDYGQVFRDFAAQVLPEISAQATMLIMGDGKNNYRPPRIEYLAQIRDQIRKVIWLNPLNMEEWSERENALSVYQPYCSRIYRCRTVDDLHLIARHLI